MTSRPRFSLAQLMLIVSLAILLAALVAACFIASGVFPSSFLQLSAISADGVWAATGWGDGRVTLWNGESGHSKGTLVGHDGMVTALAFSGDARLLATASQDLTIRLWEVQSGTLRFTLRGHRGWPVSIAFSPDGRTLASGGMDLEVHLWDTSDGKLVRTLDGFGGEIRGLAFSPDGRQMATGSGDGAAMIWNTDTGQRLAAVNAPAPDLRSVAFSGDGKRLVTAAQQTVQLWDVATGQEIARMLHPPYVTCLTVSPDGRLAATGGFGRDVKLWQLADGAQAAIFEPVMGTHALRFAPDGKILLTASWEHVVARWDVATGRQRSVRLGGRAAAWVGIVAVAMWLIVMPAAMFLSGLAWKVAGAKYGVDHFRRVARFAPNIWLVFPVVGVFGLAITVMLPGHVAVAMRMPVDEPLPGTLLGLGVSLALMWPLGLLLRRMRAVHVEFFAIPYCDRFQFRFLWRNWLGGLALYLPCLFAILLAGWLGVSMPAAALASFIPLGLLYFEQREIYRAADAQLGQLKDLKSQI